MDANETTAANLRSALARQKITRRQLADTMGTNVMWVQRRCTGHTPITVNDLERIAKALEVPLSTLLPDVAAAS